uniref:Uncharacterized protein n=1 Tax=Medicago truncatula TaxID=3880 RepID=B7FJ42_MEDTR|nr:unknown [Medicago truncatula]
MNCFFLCFNSSMLVLAATIVIQFNPIFCILFSI